MAANQGSATMGRIFGFLLCLVTSLPVNPTLPAYPLLVSSSV
jgi:hypothetical protein